jgi:choline dehydrogenase-like flavoprotein
VAGSEQRVTFPLAADERAALTAVCDALFPGHVPGAGSSQQSPETGAVALSVPDRIEETLAVLGTAEREGLRLFLRLLEKKGVMMLLSRRATKFSRLALSDRQRVLRKMSVSTVPQLRTAFQALYRLAAFHQYSTMPGGADNPLWPAIGYAPSRNAPAVRNAVTLQRLDAPARLECDVCVVGAGAGGSVVAARLAATGRKVIVIEAGSDWQSREFDQHEAMGTRELYLDRGTTTTGDLSVAFLAGTGIGGGTTVNWQSCFRTPDAVLEEWAERSGCDHFTSDSFARSLDNVWGRLAVSRRESEVNPNNSVLQRGCAALGYHWAAISRNSLGCDTAQCGYCVYGCRHGGKQTAATTFLRDAQEAGNLSVFARCRAERVVIRSGRVSGVEATTISAGTGERHRVEIISRAIVVACGGLHTPALLMRSGVSLPQLGRNLFVHPTTAMTGAFAEPIEPWSGPPQTIVCDQFASLNDGYGYRLEAAPAHPGLLAMATPWANAEDHERSMQLSAHRAVVIVLVRDRSVGRVTVSHEGRPVIHYVPRAQEKMMLRHGMANAARILHAAGAEEIQSLHAKPMAMRVERHADGNSQQSDIDRFCGRLGASSTGKNRVQLFSAHQMGTCRMGSDARHAVCDERGEVFGVRGLYVGDASAFPGSSGVNPMITIMAMAHHTAGRIAESL